MKLFVFSIICLLRAALADIDPIIIKGSKFFYASNDTQFYIRGVAYQQNFHTASPVDDRPPKDPLADPASCKRDIPILQELRTNTIRVYAIDPDSSHDECMDMLADAGIYVLCDLADSRHAINRQAPSWENSLYSRYADVIDEMAQYSNTLGFFVGNEVADNAVTTGSSAFVKAAVRDMKTYIKDMSYRHIGVGYATNDDAEIRDNIASYLNCDNTDDSVDFWGYNIYSWCGNSSYEHSGYKDRTDQFRNYTVPVFFAEYGCNQVLPREFAETDALYREPMDQVWSGGVVYMFFQEANNYGLVSIIDGDRISKLDDFEVYSKRIASASPSGVNKKSYTPTNIALRECPTVDFKWAAATPLPPTPDSDLCECMTDSAACVVADSTPVLRYGELFDAACSFIDCSDISANSTTGKYGRYSVCDPRQKLNIILNKYYMENGPDSGVCSFSGFAVMKETNRSADDCSIATEVRVVDTKAVATVSPKQTEDSLTGAPCSCSCNLMETELRGMNRTLCSSSNLLSLGPELVRFELPTVITAVLGFAFMHLL